MASFLFRSFVRSFCRYSKALGFGKFPHSFVKYIPRFMGLASFPCSFGKYSEAFGFGELPRSLDKYSEARGFGEFRRSLSN